MAKRKLFVWIRDKLKRHVTEHVVPAAEKAVLDKAYAKAAKLVAAIIEKKNPPADMAILAKYGKGGKASEFRLQFPNMDMQEFKFDDDDRPYIANCGYNEKVYLADERTAFAIDAWRDAKAAFEAEQAKRRTAYYALIDGSKYVDDLVDVWPEAVDLIPAGSLPILLGPEQIAMVKADMKERKVAA